MTKALAGELGFPMVCVSANELCSNGVLRTLPRIINLGKRYQNCIIFIDEAEKLFGNARFGEDNYLMGEFNRLLDGINDDEVKSLFILAVNDFSRIGYALKDRMVHLEFSLPDFEERLLFIKQKMELCKDQRRRKGYLRWRADTAGVFRAVGQDHWRDFPSQGGRPAGKGSSL